MADELSDEEKERLFRLLGEALTKGSQGEFDPKKGGLKHFYNAERNEWELRFVPPVSEPEN